eukprot:3500210-Rhodomonas_salina.1
MQSRAENAKFACVRAAGVESSSHHGTLGPRRALRPRHGLEGVDLVGDIVLLVEQLLLLPLEVLDHVAVRHRLPPPHPASPRCDRALNAVRPVLSHR